MSRINNIGVTCEIVGVIAVIGAVLHPRPARTGGRVRHRHGRRRQPGYVWAWIVSGLMAAYVMVGFGSAGELAEETRNPRRVAPRTIRLALSVSALGGGLMILGALMAAPSLTDGRLATEGLPYVLDRRCSARRGAHVLLSTSRSQSSSARWPSRRRPPGWCSRWPATDGCPPRSPVDGQPPHRNPHRAVGPHRCALHRRAGGQRRQLGHLRDPHQCLHHPDLPGLPDGHGAAAVPQAQGLAARQRTQVDADGRKLFSLGRFGRPGQHRWRWSTAR